jgi:transcriptional regulator with XRE-family HTH domain
MVNVPEITPAQVRAARGWLSWTQDELAHKAGTSQRTIARLELGVSVPYGSTLAKIRQAFETAGVGFQFDGGAASGISFRPATQSGSGDTTRASSEQDRRQPR